jgi:DNA-binding NtrC family response regulator
MESGTILIVDDESSLRKVLSDLLKMRGYSSDAVATGPEAMESVRSRQYDVAIVDLRLGEDQMTGMEVIRSIKGCAPDTECVVLTANPTQQSAIQAVNLGAYSYIEKPFNYEKLLETIKNAIEKRRESSELVSARKTVRQAETQKRQLENRLRRECLSPLEHISDAADRIRNCASLEEAHSLALEISTETQTAVEAISRALESSNGASSV